MAVLVSGVLQSSQAGKSCSEWHSKSVLIPWCISEIASTIVFYD